MSIEGLIGIVASLLAIIQFVKSYKDEIDDWIESLELPSEVNFYFLSFYALVAAFLGGMLWNILNRVNEQYPFMGPASPYVGGTQSEPHGIAAVIWPIATTIPVAVALWLLNRKYEFMKTRDHLILLSAFLVGITVG